MTSITTDYDCPAWCQRTDHDAEEVSPAYPPFHHGPDFGAFGTQNRGEGAAYAVLHDVDSRNELTAGELRRLGREALAAADWVDQHERIAPGDGGERLSAAFTDDDTARVAGRLGIERPALLLALAYPDA